MGDQMKFGKWAAPSRQGLVVVFACLGVLFFANRSFGGGAEVVEAAPEVALDEIPVALRDHSLPPG